MQKRAQSVIEISLLFCLAAIIVMPVILKINSSNLSFADNITKKLNSVSNSVSTYNSDSIEAVGVFNARR